jgi:hypothetical protein
METKGATGGPKSKHHRLREVEVEDPPIRMVWADPKSLDENPLNWKIHTDFQTEVVSELIRKHGWIKPLIFNSVTKRLLDGHDRRKISIARGLAAVPVIIGTWPEEQEPEILGSLDPSAALAKGEPDAIQRLLDQMQDPAPVIDRLITELAESNGLLDRLSAEQPTRIDPTFTPDPGPSGYGTRIDDFPPGEPGMPPPGAPPESPPIPHYQPVPSSVKMIQLYLDTDTFREFREMVAAIQDRYDVTTETDLVMAVMREAYEAHRTSTGGDPE